MTQEKFLKYFNEILQDLIDKNVRKGNEYARNNNRLHNFIRGAMEQRLSPLKYLDVLRSKHEVSIKDMIDDRGKGKKHLKELWKEKITDDIMYLLLLYAMVGELDKWGDI